MFVQHVMLVNINQMIVEVVFLVHQMLFLVLVHVHVLLVHQVHMLLQILVLLVLLVNFQQMDFYVEIVQQEHTQLAVLQNVYHVDVVMK